ncbi:hypothetical protein [Cryptobacterium curtum]|uniref:hypothetical protein n=1 Tax=Cryptobacterium curtum TaxID=84163 RepID=UPI00117D7563|nr:hypothetical protein [Cryptobacterium curtum]
MTQLRRGNTILCRGIPCCRLSLWAGIERDFVVSAEMVDATCRYDTSRMVLFPDSELVRLAG